MHTGRSAALAEAARLREQGAIVVTAQLEAPGIVHAGASFGRLAPEHSETGVSENAPASSGTGVPEQLERQAHRLADGESVRYGGHVYGVFLGFFERDEGNGKVQR